MSDQHKDHTNMEGGEEHSTSVAGGQTTRISHQEPEDEQKSRNIASGMAKRATGNPEDFQSLNQAEDVDDLNAKDIDDLNADDDKVGEKVKSGLMFSGIVVAFLGVVCYIAGRMKQNSSRI